jgi:hypothetical protein
MISCIIIKHKNLNKVLQEFIFLSLATHTLQFETLTLLTSFTLHKYKNNIRIKGYLSGPVFIPVLVPNKDQLGPTGKATLSGPNE